MKVVVHDPRLGEHRAELHVFDTADWRRRVLSVGYSPSVHHDAAAGELVVLDSLTQPDAGAAGMIHRLNLFDAESLSLQERIPIPQRPMYTGLPGRSSGAAVTRSGRHVYFVESTRHPVKAEYRLVLHRYDRRAGLVRTGSLAVDSCMLQFCQLGPEDEDIAFHLTCEFPSSILVGRFDRAEYVVHALEAVAPRTYRPQETCASWLDAKGDALYCVTREGCIHRVERQAIRHSPLCRLPLKAGSAVPLHQLHGDGPILVVGTTDDQDALGAGMATAIWLVSSESGAITGGMDLPVPLTNFVVTDGGATLFGVNHVERRLYMLDLVHHRVVRVIDDAGLCPAEVVLMP